MGQGLGLFHLRQVFKVEDSGLQIIMGETRLSQACHSRYCATDLQWS